MVTGKQPRRRRSPPLSQPGQYLWFLVLPNRNPLSPCHSGARA